jgi:GTP-binding protein Era
MNALVGRKLSIVTSTPQTTRQRILGILSRDRYQMVFLDTPGMLEPRYTLQERMLEHATTATHDADVIVILVEAREPLRTREVELVHQLAARRAQRPLVVALNKIDRVVKPLLLPMIDMLSTIDGVADIVPIAALRGEGLDVLESVIAGHLPESPPYFPPDALSDQPERFFVAEIVREKVFLHYGEEIPFSTAVIIDAFEEVPGRKVRIRARVIVERDSQKGILIGQRGAGLKRVGTEARRDIEAFLGKPVHLELWASVRKRWRADQRFLRELGL